MYYNFFYKSVKIYFSNVEIDPDFEDPYKFQNDENGKRSSVFNLITSNQSSLATSYDDFVPPTSSDVNIELQTYYDYLRTFPNVCILF